MRPYKDVERLSIELKKKKNNWKKVEDERTQRVKDQKKKKKNSITQMLDASMTDV